MFAHSRTVSIFFVAAMSFALVGCVTSGQPDGSPKQPFVKNNVDPTMARACAIAAANRYYLPTRVITAVDSAKAVDGATVVKLKVDLRDAVCTVNPSGSIRSVIDTSPKSADQIAAEQAAAAIAEKKKK